MAERLEDRIIDVLRGGPKSPDEVYSALGDVWMLATVFDCMLDMAKQGKIVVGEPLADKRRPYSLHPKPEPLSVWEHHSGRLYRVLYVVNDAIPAKPKYPAMVVYEGAENGKRWAGLLSDWHRRMTLRPDLAEESDTEIRLEQESPTEAQELRVALANLTDAFLSRHGCFPLDCTNKKERDWHDAMTDAYRLVGRPGSSHRVAEMARNESAVETQPEPTTEIQSDIAAAPPAPQLFLAENAQGDWIVAERYHPYGHGFKDNYVINRRTGRWWDLRRWRPLDPASPANGRDV